ncbi:DUF397 domain-containing protein [Actinacidiphila sp. bgisy144]|uniref:DUF397 domain-containing protein n=1 Tax=Actinacidiphila sp. bgisy144 TaxID=3413791 RepID=UPI003EB7AC03
MALEATVGDDGMIYIRETRRPDVVAVTTPAKWEAFVKGVKAGEFDHFVTEAEAETDAESDTDPGKGADAGRATETG